MGARGRKSSAELTVVPSVLVIRRPEPPACLTDEAAAEWRAVVDTFAADHFNRGLQPVLEGYCEHAAARRKIGQMLKEAEEERDDGDAPTVASYDRLLLMHERESRALAALAVRLRIANATHVPASARAVAISKPLWER